MQVQVRWVDKIPIVEIIGGVDAHTCPELKQRIIELVDSGNAYLVISMIQVDYIDSSALGTLVSALKRANEQQGTLALVITNPQIIKVMDITGLINVFEIFDQEFSALRRIRELYVLSG
jgi:anti-sigma B factor antagonist